MKQITLNSLINKILIIFLIVQPIFDVKFLYNSMSTLIRVIIIFALFLYYFFTSKNKHKFWLLIYPALLGIYFIFHHLNSLNFYSLVPGNFSYSITKEFLYFVKMVSPFLLIYCIYKAALSTDTVISVMKSLVLTISLVIIISNLFVFSYGNYSNEVIEANFFEWFNPNSHYTYKELASKGLFEFGNQIGAILIMFLPFMIYLALNKRKFINCLTVIFNIFALILLCTRVSVLGVLVVFTYTAFAFYFIAFLQKRHFEFKQYIPIGFIFLVYISLLPVNPMFNRLSERETVIETFHEKEENAIIESPVTEELPNVESVTSDNNNMDIETPTNDSSDYRIKYIEENYESKQLHKQFLFENYPYTYDPEFWYEFLQNDISLTTDYRYIELSMIKRVVELNNNKMDKWLGITNTRLQNIFNIERDFIVHYYAIRYYWSYISLCTIFCNFRNIRI